MIAGVVDDVSWYFIHVTTTAVSNCTYFVVRVNPTIIAIPFTIYFM